MCLTEEKRHLQQRMQNKPQKGGLKLFVLCDSHGYVYKFEMSNGAVDNIVLPGTPDLGAMSNVVVRLSKSVADDMHHIMCFDNDYTSIPLLMYLRSRGIYSLGSFRSNEISGCKLPLESEIKNQPKGYSIEFVSNVNDASVNVVLWKDDKCLRMASTYVGVEPFTSTTNSNQQRAKATRTDRKEKSSIDDNWPHVNKQFHYSSLYIPETNG